MNQNLRRNRSRLAWIGETSLWSTRRGLTRVIRLVIFQPLQQSQWLARGKNGAGAHYRVYNLVVNRQLTSCFASVAIRQLKAQTCCAGHLMYLLPPNIAGKMFAHHEFDQQSRGASHYIAIPAHLNNLPSRIDSAALSCNHSSHECPTSDLRPRLEKRSFLKLSSRLGRHARKTDYLGVLRLLFGSSEICRPRGDCSYLTSVIFWSSLPFIPSAGHPVDNQRISEFCAEFLCGSESVGERPNLRSI